MSTLTKRLVALENAIAPSHNGYLRVYWLQGVGTDEEAADFVHNEGWAFDGATDMLVRFVGLTPDIRDGSVCGSKPSEDAEKDQLRWMYGPKNPEWRRDL